MCPHTSVHSFVIALSHQFPSSLIYLTPTHSSDRKKPLFVLLLSLFWVKPFPHPHNKKGKRKGTEVVEVLLYYFAR